MRWLLLLKILKRDPYTPQTADGAGWLEVHGKWGLVIAEGPNLKMTHAVATPIAALQMVSEHGS